MHSLVRNHFSPKAASSKVKSKLFAMALKKKQSLLDKGDFTNDTIWDKILFKKIRNRIGESLTNESIFHIAFIT